MHDIITTPTQSQGTNVIKPLECGDKDSAMEPNSSSTTPPTLDELHEAYTAAMLALHQSKVRREARKRDPRIFDANSDDKHNELYRAYLRARNIYLTAVERAREGGAV